MENRLYGHSDYPGYSVNGGMNNMNNNSIGNGNGSGIPNIMMQQQQQQQQQQQTQLSQQQYTLPGIMQYLQSQFTIIEKNRMMNDLEKSSLKLKIIELESERNALKLTNEKLNLKVTELEKALELSKSTHDNNKNRPKHNRTKSKNGISSSSDNSIPSTANPASNINETLQELDIQSSQLTKLVNARKFLKSATNEILYLLKSPSIELNDPLNLTKEDSFFVDPNLIYNKHNLANQFEPSLSEPILENNTNINNTRVANSNTNDYIDMAVGLDTAFGSNSNGHSSDTHDLPEDISDAETFVEESDDSGAPNSIAAMAAVAALSKNSNNGDNKSNGNVNGTLNGNSKSSSPPKQQKPRVILAKRNTGSQEVASTIAVPKLKRFKVSTGKVVALSSSSIKVYLDDMSTLQASIPLETTDSKTLIDFKITQKFIIIAFTNKLHIFSNDFDGQTPSPLTTQASKSDIKSIDYDELNEELLITTENEITLYKATLKGDNDKSIEVTLSPVTNVNFESNLTCCKFIKSNVEGYDIAVLADKSLILQKIRASNLTNSKAERQISLPQFTDLNVLVMNSVALIFKGENENLFGLDLSNPTQFTNLSVNPKIQRIDCLISCEDDDSKLAVIMQDDTEVHINLVKINNIPFGFNAYKIMSIDKNNYKGQISSCFGTTKEGSLLIGYGTQSTIKLYEAN